jgi:hypothetical protein
MHGLATDRAPKSDRIRSRTAMVELECIDILRGTPGPGMEESIGLENVCMYWEKFIVRKKKACQDARVKQGGMNVQLARSRAKNLTAEPLPIGLEWL